MCIISTDVASYFRHFSHTQSMALFGYPKAQLLTAYVQEGAGSHTLSSEACYVLLCAARGIETPLNVQLPAVIDPTLFDISQI
jgi:hypothetical protein